MGCNLRDLAQPETLELNTLSGQRIGVDAFLTAFQFLTTIRDRSPEGDGGPLKSSNGKVVSHLMGFLNRTTTLLPAMRKYRTAREPRPVIRSSIVDTAFMNTSISSLAKSMY